MRSLMLGFGLAASAAIWLFTSGMPLWAAGLIAWIGGNMLGLAFTAIGVRLWPETPARRSSFTATETEFRLWDEDLVVERINADLRRDPAPAAVVTAVVTAVAPAAAPVMAPEQGGHLREAG